MTFRAPWEAESAGILERQCNNRSMREAGVSPRQCPAWRVKELAYTMAVYEEH